MTNKNRHDCAVVWFRYDLRLADNPAWSFACANADKVLPVFIWDKAAEEPWAMGGASRWWLHESLASLTADLQKKGSDLYVFSGSTQTVLNDIISGEKATLLAWNRRYEPALIARDKTLKSSFKEQGLQVETFNSALLFEPWIIKNGAGLPYKVFTPYWKACLQAPPPDTPVPAPKTVPPLPLVAKITQKERVELQELKLKPKIPWDTGFAQHWQPGEAGGQKQLKAFLNSTIQKYQTARDRMDQSGTSLMSPYLHFGSLSPRQIWHAISQTGKSVETYRKELVWREFAHHLLFHFPDVADTPLRREFLKFPWTKNPAHLRAWQKGKTGYPIVDAAMQQLWVTGWMHNRARMIVASFLVKHLLLPWQEGAKWFWDTLVDADLASNTMGWQWSAGCGADAAPYFRVFNPILQGEKFDPEGEYVRKWVPALKKMPSKWIHKPWEAETTILDQAGVRLGMNYPKPIVEHSAARQRALAAYKKLRS